MPKVKPPSEFDLLVARRFKAFREAVGLKQPGMAKALGLSRSAVSNFEQGTRGLAQDVLQRIVLTFRVSADWFIVGDLSGTRRDTAAKIEEEMRKLDGKASSPSGVGVSGKGNKTIRTPRKEMALTGPANSDADLKTPKTTVRRRVS